MKVRALALVVATLLVAAGPGAAAGGRRSVTVTKVGGLGRIEVNGGVGAVLQRDEGVVALLDLKGPAPKVLGTYGEGTRNSLDGDLAFSKDGQWVFYARQTDQFSMDGLHVLNVADPKAPMLTHYQPAGGAYRVATYNDGADEWVVLLDAILGLVVYRFVPEVGQLVPVHVDPLPELKVGGPASAGIHIDPKDPKLKKPLMYVTTGKTGLQVFDLSDPTAPALLGSWDDEGLAEVEVIYSGGRRMVYAASEYWFDKSAAPTLWVIDATKLDAINGIMGTQLGPSGTDQIQGMAVAAGNLLVAFSSRGLLEVDRLGRSRVLFRGGGKPNPGAGVLGAPFAMDVETQGRSVFLTDAATGQLTVLGR